MLISYASEWLYARVVWSGKSGKCGGDFLGKDLLLFCVPSGACGDKYIVVVYRDCAGFCHRDVCFVHAFVFRVGWLTLFLA